MWPELMVTRIQASNAQEGLPAMQTLNAKNMVAAVFNTLLIGIILFAVANWGRRIGVESTAVANVPNIVFSTKPHECIQLRDWECLRVGNELSGEVI